MKRVALVLIAACKSSGGDDPASTADVNRFAAVTWHAKVALAEGYAFAQGSPCEVTAKLRSDGSSRVGADVKIACGTTTVFSGPEFAGGSGRSCTVYEEPADETNTFRYRLECTDKGGDDRPRLLLDTKKGTAVIDGLGTPKFHVALEVDKTSSIHHGRPLYDGNVPRDPGFGAAVDRRGKVVETIGLGDEMRAAACTLHVEPRTGRFNCHITLTCAGKTLYGGEGNGFTTCAIENHVPLRANDAKGIAEEGDPKLAMDLAAGEVIFSNDDPGATYRAKIVLEKTAEQPNP